MSHRTRDSIAVKCNFLLQYGILKTAHWPELGPATFIHMLDFARMDASHIIKIYTDQPKGARYIICSLIHVSYAISETPVIWFSHILDLVFHHSTPALIITLFGPKGDNDYILKIAHKKHIHYWLVQTATSRFDYCICWIASYFEPSKIFRLFIFFRKM